MGLGEADSAQDLGGTYNLFEGYLSDSFVGITSRIICGGGYLSESFGEYLSDSFVEGYLPDSFVGYLSDSFVSLKKQHS